VSNERWQRRLDSLRWGWLDRLRGADVHGSIVSRNPRLFLVRRREQVLGELAGLPPDDPQRPVLVQAAELALDELRSGNLWRLT
jgi:hypothetical protein